MNFTITPELWTISGDGWTLSRGTRHAEQVVHLFLTRNGVTGTGECTPLKRYGYDQARVQQEAEGWLQKYDWSRDLLLETMPANPTRNLIDCALWNLEANERSIPLWQHVGLQQPPRAIDTAFSLSGGAPLKMAAQAAHLDFAPWLKLKLLGDGQDAERITTIHHTAPTKDLIVDANEGLTADGLQELLPIFQACRVVLIEQPLPAGKDIAALRGITSPIPLAADESCHDIGDLEQLSGAYQVVNLKLDKTGGLTNALAMKKRAYEMGMDVMVGCMLSTSLALYPAFLLAQDVKWADLDGAWLLTEDRQPSLLHYQGGQVGPA